jgi:hypothetical protein
MDSKDVDVEKSAGLASIIEDSDTGMLRSVAQVMCY